MSIKRKIHIRSKWAKTRILLRNGHLSSYVPETRRFHAKSLRDMLARHSMVYIKPDSGTYGNGVMKVEQKRSSHHMPYSYHLLDKNRRFRSFSELLRSIRRHKLKRPYLIQKGIRLLRYRGRRFDIRVMIQKKTKNQWKATGMIGRVAHPDKIVTNYHSGGKPTDVGRLFRPYLKSDRLSDLINILSEVGTAASITLSNAYPGVNMVGADIGVDSEFKPWIIELNTRPDPYIFKHLKDRSVYRRVLRYARALGRVPTAKKTRKRRRNRPHIKGGRV